MYEPTNWKTGDVVTSAKLNKLEQGLANSGLLIYYYSQNAVSPSSSDEDKTIYADSTLTQMVTGEAFRASVVEGGRPFMMATVEEDEGEKYVGDIYYPLAFGNNDPGYYVAIKNAQNVGFKVFTYEE